eukprot:scaffold2036_cov256-Pinguiococcus_pyrenoidosus.AAC.3
MAPSMHFEKKPQILCSSCAQISSKMASRYGCRSTCRAAMVRKIHGFGFALALLKSTSLILYEGAASRSPSVLPDEAAPIPAVMICFNGDFRTPTTASRPAPSESSKPAPTEVMLSITAFNWTAPLPASKVSSSRVLQSICSCLT